MTPPMMLRFIRNDLRRDKAIVAILIMVMTLSAFLMASGAIVCERLTGAVDRLFDKAQPPHFLQMHQGEVDHDALAAFAQDNPMIDSWFIEDMIGIDGQAIQWESGRDSRAGDLSTSMIDNLFVTQNDQFDFLLDATDDSLARPTPGEVFVPIAYREQFNCAEGDLLTLHAGKQPLTLRIAGFVRDAQMASSMSSSTRFVISDEDFNALASSEMTNREIIVEYRLTDPALSGDIQRAFESNHALPHNGQAVTGTMIRMINVLSDGLTALAFIFASVILIVIALFSARFVIRGSLEDDIHEIGAMRAIGVPARTIRTLYLARYAAMALVSCVVGAVLAAFASRWFTATIAVNFSQAPISVWTVCAPIIALVILFALIVGICARLLRAVGRVNIVDALIHGDIRTARPRRRAGQSLVALGQPAPEERTLGQRRSSHRASGRSAPGKRASRKNSLRHPARLNSRISSALLRSSHGSLNTRLALADLWEKRGQWFLMPILFFATAVLVTIPMNLLTTFDSPKIVNYMGVPEADLMINIQFSSPQGTTPDQIRTDVEAALVNDPRIERVESYARLLWETPTEEGWGTLRADAGDYSNTTMQFASGTAPADGQIALSVLNARKLSADVGDLLTVRRNGVEQHLQVSGIYQDVTSGGYTAKIQHTASMSESGARDGDGAATGENPDTRWTIFAHLSRQALPDGMSAEAAARALAEEYGRAQPGASIIAMRQYVQQTLSHITGGLSMASLVSAVFGFVAAALITTLFVRLHTKKDRHIMGIYTALGFSWKELSVQIRIKVVVSCVLGIVCGVLFCATLGQYFVGAFLGTSMGLAGLTFIVRPLIVYCLYPLIMIALAVAGALVVLAGLRRTDRSQWLR